MSQFNDAASAVPPIHYTGPHPVFASLCRDVAAGRKSVDGAWAEWQKFCDANGMTPVEPLLRNPCDFKDGDLIRDPSVRKNYRVITADKRGMAKLLNLDSGKEETWNACNNKRFVHLPEETAGVA